MKPTVAPLQMFSRRSEISSMNILVSQESVPAVNSQVKLANSDGNGQMTPKQVSSKLQEI